MSEARRLVEVNLPPAPPNIDEYTPFAPEVTEIIDSILKDDERQRSKEADDTENHVFSRLNTPNSSALTTPLEPSTVRFTPPILNPPDSLIRPKKMSKKVRTVATRVITPIDISSDEEREPSLPPVKSRRVHISNKTNDRPAMSKTRLKQDATPNCPSTTAETSNIVQEHEVQGEDVIFNDVGESEKLDMLIWIANHEFMQQRVQPVPLSARCRFVDELQREAKTAGLSEASIISLVSHTRWAYLSALGLSDSEIKSYTEHDAFGKEIDDTNLSSKSSESRKRRRSTIEETQIKKQKLCSPNLSSSSFHTADEDGNSTTQDAPDLHVPHSPMEIDNEPQEQKPHQRADVAPPAVLSVLDNANKDEEIPQQPSTPISAANGPGEDVVPRVLTMNPFSTTKEMHNREIESPVDSVDRNTGGSVHETLEPPLSVRQNSLKHQSLSPATRATDGGNRTPSAASSPLKPHPWWLMSSVLPKSSIDVNLAREVSNSPLSSAGKKKAVPHLSPPFRADKANENDTVNVAITHERSESPLSPTSTRSILRRSASRTHVCEGPGEGRLRGVLRSTESSPAGQDLRKRRSCSSVRFADEVSEKVTQEISESHLAITQPPEDSARVRNDTVYSVPASNLGITISTEADGPKTDPVEHLKTSGKGLVDTVTMGAETELSALPVGILSDPACDESARQAESPSKTLKRAEMKALKRSKKRARKQEAKKWEKQMRKERKRRARQRKKGHDKPQEPESVQEQQKVRKNCNEAVNLGNKSLCADNVHEKRRKKKSSKHKSRDEQERPQDDTEKPGQYGTLVPKTQVDSMNMETTMQPRDRSITKEGSSPSTGNGIYKAPLVARAKTPDSAVLQPPQTPSTGRSGKSMFLPLSPDPAEWSDF